MHVKHYRAIGDGRLQFTYEVEGDDITNLTQVTPEGTWSFGQYFGANSMTHYSINTVQLRGVTLDGTGNGTLTYKFYLKNESDSGSTSWVVTANNNTTNIIFTEVAV